MNMKEPSPINSSKNSIIKFGERAQKHLGYKFGGSDELLKILPNIGFKFIKKTIEDNDFTEDSVSLQVNSKNDVILTYQYCIGKELLASTIAHELGHYYLHTILRDVEYPVLFKRNPIKSLIEVEAMQFAYGFLLPEEEFKLIHEKYKGNSYEISRYFNTTQTLIEVRNRTLGIS